MGGYNGIFYDSSNDGEDVRERLSEIKSKADDEERAIAEYLTEDMTKLLKDIRRMLADHAETVKGLAQYDDRAVAKRRDSFAGAIAGSATRNIDDYEMTLRVVLAEEDDTKRGEDYRAVMERLQDMGRDNLRASITAETVELLKIARESVTATVDRIAKETASVRAKALEAIDKCEGEIGKKLETILNKMGTGEERKD